jgi:hypothetical protein
MSCVYTFTIIIIIIMNYNVYLGYICKKCAYYWFTLHFANHAYVCVGSGKIFCKHMTFSSHPN